MDDHLHGTHQFDVHPRPPKEKAANESWPPADVALRLRDRPVDEWIDVTVRIEFAAGVEFHDGTATRWWGRHVLVRVNDRRLHSWTIWVDAADVRRRTVQP